MKRKWDRKDEGKNLKGAKGQEGTRKATPLEKGNAAETAAAATNRNPKLFKTTREKAVKKSVPFGNKQRNRYQPGMVAL